MSRFALAIAIAFILMLSTSTAHGDQFRAVDVFLESDQPVAVWQFELSDPSGKAVVVGVEQGASAAFGDAPYYDELAVAQGSHNKIVIADFSLAEPRELPSGRFRLATLHLMITAGEPDFLIDLITANDSNGRRLQGAISYVYREKLRKEPNGVVQ